MDVTYYPGCSLESSARDYDESIKAVCNALDIRLLELPDWTCCGATSAHSLNEDLATSLPALNLSGAKKMGNDLVVPCPLCFNRLQRAKESAGGGIHIYDLATFLGQPVLIDRIRSQVRLSLKGTKAVCYYGCMANRPPKVTGSTNYENPCDMDIIAEALGVETKPWSYKTDCCGASFSVSRRDIVFALVKNLYDRALEAEAECMIVSCQMCQANLDLYQKDISSHFGENYHIPVFYFTELIGLALGLPGATAWMKRHMVDPIPLLRVKRLLPS